MKNKLLLLVLAIIVVLISYPRFNQQDLWGLKNYTGKAEEYNIVRGYYYSGDAVEYLYAVKYYRGELLRSELSTPWVYRCFVPYVAHFLPIKDPFTSLNITNVIFFLFTILIFYKINLLLGFKEIYSIIGCYILGISFYPFYYLTVGLVDSGFLFFFTLGFYSLIKRNDFLFLISVTLGVFAKESAIILIPVYFIYQYVFNNINFRKISKLIFYLFIIFLPFSAYLWIRYMFSDLPNYFWMPTLFSIFYNLARFRSYVAPILTLNVPGLLGCYFIYLYLLKKMRFKYSENISEDIQLKYQKLFIVLFFVLSSTGIYGYLAAVADGRSFMPMFMICIIMTIILITNYKKNIVVFNKNKGANKK
jgi:hypothetical protein